MNKDRRAQITEITDQLDALKSDIESIRDEEQEYYDNMPDSIQQGAKGDAADEAVTALDEAMDSIDSAMESANGAAQ